MNFIQQPSGVNFAGNICDIIIESANNQGFGLSVQGGGSILKEEYRPVGGRITVPLRDIMQRVAVTASIAPGVVELPTYQYQFGEDAFQTFTCLNGGVEADVDAIGFFENNWLTWQQQIRRTTFHAPQRLCYAVLDEPSAYKVKVRGYFADNTNSQITLCTLTKRGIHTLDVTYGAISGKFQQQIVAFDVWVEVRAGVNSYTQRYILVDEIYSSDYFMWANSLGGVDTAIFTGELKEDNKYQTNSAIIDGSESEYNTKVRKAFTKYTGYLGSDNERLWVLDFFNSTKRWHLDDGILRQITVSSPKLEHTRGELMGYEFTFSHSKQSKYLNITRIEVPELLEVVDPSGELFFLAPRLIQFKSAEVSSAEILFPVQYPHSKEWLQISLTTIIQQAVSAGSGSGQVSKHATSHTKGGSDPVIPFAIGAANINGSSDENFSVKDATVESMRTPGAHEGMISGKGGILKTLANGDTIFEVDFVNIRKSLRASRLTISEIEVEGGITMTGVAKMQIDKVVDLTVKPTDDPQYRANTLRLYFDNQDGKISNHFCVGDQALTKSINTNIDDFQIIHSWRVVKEVGADYIDVYKFNVNTFQKEDLDSTGATITVNREVDSGSGIPREGDVVVACGSISDENRRAYMIVQTIGINAPISEEWSYVSDFRPSAAFNLSKYSDAKQTIHQGDSFLWRTRKGIAPLLLPPEVWVEGTVASYPESYIIDGSTFVCMAKDITETPSDSSDNWLKTSGKGDAGGKGDYLVQGYCWAEDKPQRPVGSSPEGWSAGSDRGVAIIDEAGNLLTDESGAVLSEPYPASYRLWGSTATFDGATGEVVGEWSDPYQMTAEDGKDGQDGKDVDPAVVDALQAEIDAAAAAAEQAKLDAEQKALQAKIGALKTLVDDSEALKDSAFVDDIVKFIQDDDAIFEIKKDEKTQKYHVYMKSAFAERLVTIEAFVTALTVCKLKTVRNAQNQGIEIEGSQINIMDGAKVVATLTGAPLPVIEEFNSLGSSGSRELDSFSRTTSGTQSYPAQIFSGIGAGSIIHVITTLQANVAPGNNFFNPPVMAGMASVQCVLMYRANPLSAWGDYETLANCGGFNSVSVDRQITVSDSGDYSLQFRCVATPNSNGQSSSVSVGATQFSYNYLDSSNMMSWYCGNGFGLRGNKDNYVHISFLNKIMSMVVKGNFDAPFIAQAGYVINKDGGLQSFYGSKQRTVAIQIKAEKVSLGRYRYYHTINHKEYTPTVILEPTSSSWTGSYTMMAVTNTSFEIYVRNSAGQLDDCGMRVTVFGRN